MTTHQYLLTLFGLIALTGCVSHPIANPTHQNQNAKTNLAFAEQYLAGVKLQPGTQVTDSGLAYRVLKTGYGCKPTADSDITIYYQAQLADGMKVVDSSYLRGRPDTYPLNQMIAAWREALPMMAEGSSWELYVPPHLAYGSQGAGRAIPPNAAMAFRIELLKAGTCAMQFKRG
ncbi:FKBP-type peptidyl-prolyl cis-trans isomerase [Marinagarivorans algicola]|uniref:FKBP-type peptidyl-prolyl cis-trans isomerase n=1 Tax=Marinagarivorans algicola TaxID=1513270 RepID=UPI0006B4AD1E|nr:FKBP-type peptidyl-prolyl cis-trans isomerase [Marinagarivorans algicola]